MRHRPRFRRVRQSPIHNPVGFATPSISSPLLLKAQAAATDSPARRRSFGFFVFLLVNATLFIRPAELLPAIERVPIYNVLIVICILASLPVLVEQLSWRRLVAQPGAACVVAMLPAILFSLLIYGRTWEAREAMADFGKVLLYYLLLIGLVNTPRRLETFIIATLVFIITIAVIAELQHHEVIEVASITTKHRVVGMDPETGENLTVGQLYGPGIFNDPNDFSLILATAMLLLIHGFIQSPGVVQKTALLCVAAVPGYAFALTNSRGGFLALLAGLMVLGVSRFGLKKAMPLVAVAVPVMLVLFAGRMTQISLREDDSAMGRMEIWREGFTALKASSFLGIGYGNYGEEIGHVAHNSFVHAFTELGLIGGIVFVGAFYTPLVVLRCKPSGMRSPGVEGLLERWRPGLLAVLWGYAVGLCSLTRTYTVSTYLILGLGSAYCMLRAARQPQAVPSLTCSYLKQVVLVGVGCLGFFYVVVRVLV